MSNCCENQDDQNLKQKRKTIVPGNLKEGQLVHMKNYNVRTFQPKYVADYRVIKIINVNTVIVASPDGMERKCNFHHIKPILPTEAFTSEFEEFTKCIKGGNTHLSTQSSVQRWPHYNLQSNN